MASAAVTSVAVHDEHDVYLACDTTVYHYDTRNPSGPILREPKDQLWTAEDEINQLAIHNTNRGNSWILASADDAGCLRTSSNTYRIPGDPMVTCLAFRPRTRKHTEIACGGTDCTVHLWDINKSKAPLASDTVPTLASGPQVYNPPMVHALAWSPSGRFLVGGLGDGSWMVWSAEQRSLVAIARVEDAHSGSLASVLFPGWRSETENLPMQADDRLLVTTGNDGVIALWDLGVDTVCDDLVRPPGRLWGQPEEQQPATPQTLWAISHGKKPNWMVSSPSNDSLRPNALFVADTSNDITLYSLPL